MRPDFRCHGVTGLGWRTGVEWGLWVVLGQQLYLAGKGGIAQFGDQSQAEVETGRNSGASKPVAIADHAFSHRCDAQQRQQRQRRPMRGRPIALQ